MKKGEAINILRVYLPFCLIDKKSQLNNWLIVFQPCASYMFKMSWNSFFILEPHILLFRRLKQDNLIAITRPIPIPLDWLSTWFSGDIKCNITSSVPMFYKLHCCFEQYSKYCCCLWINCYSCYVQFVRLLY